MRPYIGIVTRDRPKVLEACLRHLLAYDSHQLRGQSTIRVYDSSVGAETGLVVQNIGGVGYYREVRRHDGSVDAAEGELGHMRHKIVDDFCMTKCTHCVILDDDILVTLDTIGQAIQDLGQLWDLGVGCVSLHPFKKRFLPITYDLGHRRFVAFDYTGDSSWIFPADTITFIGNQFRPTKMGFANTMFAAIRDAGWTAATALSPCYEVQHVGVDDLEGTLIHKEARKRPGWTKVLFSDYLTGRVLYSDIVMTWKLGGIDRVIGALRKEMEMLEGRNVTEQRDAFPPARGKVEIEIVDAESGVIKRLVKVDNLVVDNAKTVMAHLLGGGAAADYAVEQMTFGTGSTAPTENDVGVEIPLTPSKSVTVDYPDASSVRFTGVLESDEANGFPVNEAGLFTGTQGMIARVVFGPLTKSADFRFVFRWTIYW